MTANPWDKWYWNDWENDPALKLCSLSAQGLWMRMLCICAKADPKGYLLVAGQPLPPTDLARLVGVSGEDVEMLLNELASKGVFSRDRKSRIYSRRMVRDVQKARTARQNGRTGGNPTLCKDRHIPASDNPQVKPLDNTHIPEARYQKEGNERPKPAVRRVSYPPDFEDFWSKYPTDRLMSKKAALEAWQRLPAEDRESVMVSLEPFRQHCAQHPDYRPVHAVRFIQQRRFDGFAEFASQVRKTIHVKAGTAEWDRCAARYRSEKGKPPPTDSNGGWFFPLDWLAQH